MPSFSIGFYNTENFFDFHDNLHNHDRDFTPTGSKKWTENRYWIKVKRIGQVISQLGIEETGNSPLFIGLAEVENAKVLTDLINSEHLKEYAYGFIHFDSLDERGMDTAMLYRKNLISPEYVEPLRFVFPETGIPTDFTRDVLYVRLKFGESLIHTFVMHLPSRRDVDVNRGFRILIMRKIRQKVDEILSHDPNAYIILIGDMNGNPEDRDAVDIEVI